jgi:hypothetical protein
VDSYPHGSDYGWLATDKDGHVAIFITAGVGPIPSAVLLDREQADLAEDLVWEMPERGEAYLHVDLPRPDDFVGFARRGLFAYDWSDIHRTINNKIWRYERYSSPETPIRVGDLPPEIASLARKAYFESLSFVDSPTVQVTEEQSTNEATA